MQCIYTVNMIELVTFKMEKQFLKEVDAVVRNNGFSNRTDFIRNALREKLSDIRLREDLKKIAEMRGKAGKKISDEEIHAVGERVFNEQTRKLKEDLDKIAKMRGNAKAKTSDEESHKMEEIKLKEDLAMIRANWGKSKRKTTDEEIHKTREDAVKEIAKKLGVQI